MRKELTCVNYVEIGGKDIPFTALEDAGEIISRIIEQGMRNIGFAKISKQKEKTA